MSALNILTNTLGLIPPRAEGLKTVPVAILWNQNTNNPQTFFLINFTTQVQTAQFTSVQAVYVDNSTCPLPVLLTSIETGQTIWVPAFTLGVYPIISGNNPQISVQIAAVGPYTTKLQFFNNRQVPFQQVLPPLGNIQTNPTMVAEVLPSTTFPYVLYTHPYANRMSISNIEISILINIASGSYGPYLVLLEPGGNVICSFFVNGSIGANNPAQIYNFQFTPPWLSVLNESGLAFTISNGMPAGSEISIAVNAQIGNVVVA